MCVNSHRRWECVSPRSLDRELTAAPVGALGAPGNLQDHDQSVVVLDQEDDPQFADAQAPELRARELHRTRWPRIDREGEDRATQSSGVAGRQPSQLSLSRGGQLDPAAAVAQSGSGS